MAKTKKMKGKGGTGRGATNRGDPDRWSIRVGDLARLDRSMRRGRVGHFVVASCSTQCIR